MKMEISVFVELLAAVLFSLLKSISGCGRTVQTMPDPTTTPVPSTLHPGHRLPCTPQEAWDKGCKNGGECVTVTIDVKHILCKCPDIWSGPRCQFFNPPGVLESRNFFTARTANMAAGISVVLLLVFVIVLAIYVYIRLKKRKKETKNQPLMMGWKNNGAGQGPSSDREKESYIQEKDSQNFIEESPLNGGASNNFEMKEIDIKIYPRTSQHET